MYSNTYSEPSIQIMSSSTEIQLWTEMCSSDIAIFTYIRIYSSLSVHSNCKSQFETETEEETLRLRERKTLGEKTLIWRARKRRRIWNNRYTNNPHLRSHVRSTNYLFGALLNAHPLKTHFYTVSECTYGWRYETIGAYFIQPKKL